MTKITDFIFKFIKNNKYLILLSLFYFSLRIINLTKFPIFNDESIYLDWGWREVNTPGMLYYSLYDAKQPLLMWIFGIFELLIKDPLFAGRIVSVITGFISLLGIYKLSNTLFNKKTALFAVLFYSVIPLFSFFDRQALMESAVAAIGIWTCFLFIKLINEKNFTNAIYLGIVLGIGFFIKSSSLLFLGTYLLVSLYLFKISSKKTKMFELVFVSLLAFFCTTFLLIINPQFWSTFSTNTRFTFSVSDLLLFPISTWSLSLLINLRILFFYLSPTVFLCSLLGIYYARKTSRNFVIFIIFFAINLLLETLTVRQATDRYLVSFLPFLTIPLAYFINLILNKKNIVSYLLVCLIFLVPFVLTFFQIYKQPEYMIAMEKFSGYGNSSYLNGYTSGFGINEVIDYLNSLASSKQKIVAGIAENTGNPESAINVYANKSDKLISVYLDSRLFDTDLAKIDCLKVKFPTYFISRDNQLFGLDKYLYKVKTIKNPYGVNTIGIYKLKTNCSGKSVSLDFKK